MKVSLFAINVELKAERHSPIQKEKSISLGLLGMAQTSFCHSWIIISLSRI
jgi:hypothetical protein